MSEFVDRRNLDFVLFEMLDLDTLLTTPRYEEHDRESITAMLDVVEGIAETNFLPFAAKLDANEPKFVDGKVEIIISKHTHIYIYIYIYITRIVIL